MPLDPDDEAPRRILHGLCQTIVGPAGDCEPARAGDALVVVRGLGGAWGGGGGAGGAGSRGGARREADSVGAVEDSGVEPRRREHHRAPAAREDGIHVRLRDEGRGQIPDIPSRGIRIRGNSDHRPHVTPRALRDPHPQTGGAYHDKWRGSRAFDRSNTPIYSAVRLYSTDAQGDGAQVKLTELREAAARGVVDTVMLALPDMQGRLQGKRMTATHFHE